MINQSFKDNWLKILDYNKKTVLSKDHEVIKTIVRIPLTPIELDAKILQELFELFYPQFINDQQNILDLIISDDENSILNAYLYITKKAGIHESIEKLPLEMISDNIFPYQKKDLENIELFFNKLQLRLVERKKVRISSIRIFKKKCIELINESGKNFDSITINDGLKRFFDFIQSIYEQDLFYMHPNPTINYFIKDLLKFLNGIKLSRIIEIILEILPDSKISFLFRLIDSFFTLDLIKQSNSSINNDITINIRTLDELTIKTKYKKPFQEILDDMLKILKSDKSYYLDMNMIITLFQDIFEIKIPPTKEKIEFITQKGLYGIRSFEKSWSIAPRIKLFNLKRYFIRNLGINLNIKKLSHWSIPQSIISLLNIYYGLKFRILVIYTDVNGNKMNSNDYLNYSIKVAAIFDFENGSINNIIPIKKEELLSNDIKNSLEMIRSRISRTRGYISAIMTIDKNLLSNLVDTFIYNISSLNIFAKIKVLKMLKNEIYLNMYPMNPIFKLIRDSGTIKLLKLLTAIFIDKHEF